MLVELKASIEARNKFAKAVKGSVMDMGSVQTLQHKITYEVRDVDKTVECAEVKSAIVGCVQSEELDEVEVRMSAKSLRGNKTAYVTDTSEKAARLAKIDRIKII